MTSSDAQQCEETAAAGSRTGCSPACCCWARPSGAARTIAPHFPAACSTATSRHRCAVPAQDRRQLHDPELPGRAHHQLQLLHAAGPDRPALARHLRQRRAHGQHVVQRRPRAQDLVHQRLVDTHPATTARTPDPGREDRQAESRRARPRPRSACRSPTGSRSRCCSTRPRARSSTTRDRPTTCTASRSGRPQRDGRATSPT